MWKAALQQAVQSCGQHRLHACMHIWSCCTQDVLLGSMPYFWLS